MTNIKIIVKKFRFASLAVVTVTAAGLVLSHTSAAGNAQLYITPNSQSLNTGSNLTLNVIVDTKGATVNAIQSTITYPANFSYVSMTPSSAFSTPFLPTPSSGSVNFAAGTGGTPVSGVQTVATLVLHANSAGSGAVSFSDICSGTASSTCSAVVDNVTNLNVLGTINLPSTSYTVTTPSTPPPPTPTPTPKPTPTPTPTPSKSSSSSSTTKKTTTSTATPTATPTPAIATPGAPKISGIAVTDISVDSATINWQTDVPASSVVNYGTSTQYGFVAQASGMVTNHSVTLGAPNIVEGATFYFTVTSAAASGGSATSETQQFNTPGFAVTIVVNDKHGKHISNAKLTLNNKTAKTNQQGVAALQDVAAGKQQVTIDVGGKITKQFIQVGKIDPVTKTYVKQQFTLTAATGSSSWAYIIIVVFVLIALVLALARKFPPNLHRSSSSTHGSMITPTTVLPGNQKAQEQSITVIKPSSEDKPGQPGSVITPQGRKVN